MNAHDVHILDVGCQKVEFTGGLPRTAAKELLPNHVPRHPRPERADRKRGCAVFGSNSTATLRIAAALLMFVPSLAVAADTDQDGIDDGVENALLARYRPYYLFASDEENWPLPATTYVFNTELKTKPDSGAGTVISVQQLRQNPLNVLQANQSGADLCSDGTHCSSNLTLNARVTSYALNALDSPPGGYVGASPFAGFSKQAVASLGNVGLYGHVVPIKLVSPSFPCATRWNTVGRPDTAQTFYKVEYWQFFGFNNAHQSLGIGNHEGDWTSVQLLIRPASIVQGRCGNGRICTVPIPERVVAVTMFAHGKEFRFVLRNPNSPDRIWTQAGQTFGEFHGSNYGKSVSIDVADNQCDASLLNAQDNTLRMVRDATGGWTHPAVYIERGGHELWPTESWDLWDKIGGIKYYVPPHKGDGIQFLTAAPPNLGEVEAPLGTDTNRMIVLRYNGHWGADNSHNTPPHGPPLHAQWTWPTSSSIDWQLPKDLDY
jgi:hypothetical protein